MRRAAVVSALACAVREWWQTMLAIPVSENPLTGHGDRVPEDDLFDLDASSMRFTADGWAALIEPLPPGHHVITVRSAGEFPGSGGPVDSKATLQLDVLRH